MEIEAEVDNETIESGLPAVEELQRLRKSQKSILAKSHERKARIAELETENAALKAKAGEADAKMHDATVGVPLRAMAAQVSEVPKLWLSEFSKYYKVGSADGTLSVLKHDGSPVMVGESPVPFTPNGLWTLLTGGAQNYGKDEDTASFAAIMRWCGPTGSGASGINRGGSGNPPVSTHKAPKKSVETQFGIR
jgi:hypothetical protein